MLHIDGSFGEGGGQILRSSLGLSLVTGKSFRLEKIRAGRKKPGLLRQHLTAVRAAAKIGQAQVEGDREGSRVLEFQPGKVAPGEYFFSIGTAGSATLVLQAILPALLVSEGETTVIVEGGTHNHHAPPFPHFAFAFVPLLNALGANVAAELIRAGFYPVGGGKIRLSVKGPARWQPLHLGPAEGAPRMEATAVVSKLPAHIAQRELRVLAERLRLTLQQTHEVEETASGPGNVCYITIERSGVVDVFSGFGQRGVPAEDVAEAAANEAEEFLQSQATVGPHLADQLLIPMALAGGGSFCTTKPTLHTTTNAEVIGMFLDISVTQSPLDETTWRVSVARREK